MGSETHFAEELTLQPKPFISEARQPGRSKGPLANKLIVQRREPMPPAIRPASGGLLRCPVNSKA
jgi:hypothetical protein